MGQENALLIKTSIQSFTYLKLDTYFRFPSEVNGLISKREMLTIALKALNFYFFIFKELVVN